jgi:hypothetical protein
MLPAAENAYERNCVECHKAFPMTLQRMFMNYLLVYSGEKNTKAALKHYLRYPLRDTSVMSELFLKNFDIKKPLRWISEEELDEAIDIYWEKYKVIGRLK